MRSALLFVVVSFCVCLVATAADHAAEKEQQSADYRLYTKPYQVNEHGAITLPAGVRWKVMPQYRGRTEGGEPILDDRLTLVLVDDDNSFWPVIAKMPLGEAQALRDQLTQVIEAKLAQTASR